MLEIEPETVYFLILKAREFDDKDAPGTPDEDATPAEETIELDMHYYADDPVAQQIKDTIGATAELIESLGKPLVFVLNGATPRARINAEALSVLSRHGMLAPVVLHQRIDFAASMIDGRTVMELPDSSRSSEEVEKLWSYVSDRLTGAAPRPRLPCLPQRPARAPGLAMAGAGHEGTA